jgi:hypothetical protein
MQHHVVRIGIAHFGNFLPLGDGIPFPDHQGTVVCIRRQEGCIVFDDEQIAVTAQPIASINHPTTRSGPYRSACRPTMSIPLLFVSSKPLSNGPCTGHESAMPPEVPAATSPVPVCIGA